MRPSPWVTHSTHLLVSKDRTWLAVAPPHQEDRCLGFLHKKEPTFINYLEGPRSYAEQCIQIALGTLRSSIFRLSHRVLPQITTGTKHTSEGRSQETERGTEHVGHTLASFGRKFPKFCAKVCDTSPFTLCKITKYVGTAVMGLCRTVSPPPPQQDKKVYCSLL